MLLDSVRHNFQEHLVRSLQLWPEVYLQSSGAKRLDPEFQIQLRNFLLDVLKELK